jgi:hypothetical protein
VITIVTHHAVLAIMDYVHVLLDNTIISIQENVIMIVIRHAVIVTMENAYVL